MTTQPSKSFQVIPIESTEYVPRMVEISLPTVNHVRILRETFANVVDIFATGEFTKTEQGIFNTYQHASTTLQPCVHCSSVGAWFEEMFSGDWLASLILSLDSCLALVETHKTIPIGKNYVAYSTQQLSMPVKVGIHLKKFHHAVALVYILGSTSRVKKFLSNRTMLDYHVLDCHATIIPSDEWEEFMNSVLTPNITN